ncbi:rhombosortase [Microbulbifer sp. TYP-18]|uniref:rhombosortase n=1 Tax=Microbulbifer sp. TYP-18 TaxID=3230024 RepID=UPI0034C6C10D
MGQLIFLALVTLTSLLASLSSNFSSALVFDRNAIFDGEIWRIITGHLVHFSTTHLTFNLFAFLVLGYVMENKKYPNPYIFYFSLSMIISICLLIFKPHMNYYGGLSGIAYGILYYCALMGIKEARPWQTICLFAVFFVPIKIAVEIYINASPLPSGSGKLFIPMQTSHISGCLVAIIFYLIGNRNKSSIAKAYRDM